MDTKIKSNGLARTVEQFIFTAQQIHGLKYDYSKVKYKNRDTSVIIICNKHGEFTQRPYRHITEKRGCPKCYSEFLDDFTKGKTSNTSQFVVKSKVIHGNLYDYSETNYLSRNERVFIKCKQHGIFSQTPDQHLRGRGCPICGQLKARGKLYVMDLTKQSIRITTEEFIAKARKVHGNRYDYSQTIYVAGKKKLTIICRKHGPFLKEANCHILNEQGCPKCNLSKGELRISTYLDKHAVEYKRQKTFSELKGINGGALKYDFYIPSRNILIEYDGELHFDGNEFRGRKISKYSIDNLKHNDNIKTQYAKTHDIILIRIPFTDKDIIPQILDEHVINSPLANKTTLFSLISVPDGEVF